MGSVWLERSARAADSDAVLEQMTTLNASALEDYSNGDFDKARSRLLQAVGLAKKDPNLQGHPMLARTYVHLGALYVDGIEDRKAGVGYFVKALKLKPDIEVTEALLTKSVQSAFDTARAEAKVDVKSTAKEATAAASPAAGAPPAGRSTATTTTPAPAPPPTKVAAASPADKTAAEGKTTDKAPEVAVVAARSEKSEKADAKAAAAEKKKAEAAARDAEKQAQSEREKQQKELAALKDGEAKERAAKEKLIADKAASDKALADTKAQVLQLEKDKAERDKAVAAEKDKLQKDLAALKDSEGKERAAKEKLIAEKAVTDKALADTRAQVLQLEKDKAERDKQLAEAGTREKREREAKEKLLAEKQAAETREKERKAEEDAARQARAKLAEGPDVPAHFAEPIHCDLPDEAAPETDVFVHCLAKPGLAAKDMAIYYRTGNSTHYNSLELRPSKKGWQSAVIPASQVSGKALQYYVEVRDGHGAVAAANGKAASPNILSLRHATATARIARGSTSSGGERKQAVLIQR
jgi:hypothetical protein